MMPWFKVDDGFHAHRKARAAIRSNPSKRRDAAAIGLWQLAGTWAAQNLTDGFVPADELDRWDDDWLNLSERLVMARLWDPAEQDGEDGFQFIHWEEFQPLKADLEEKADADSASGKLGNHVRWHVNKGVVDPACDLCSPPNRPGDRHPNRGGESPNGSPPNPPSRPDPSRPDPSPEGSLARCARFEEWWNTYDKKVGRKSAEAKYRLALRKPGVTEELLIAAAAAYVTSQRARGAHPQYTANPTTWLNGERWNDEPLAPAPAAPGESRARGWLRLATDEDLPS